MYSVSQDVATEGQEVGLPWWGQLRDVCGVLARLGRVSPEMSWHRTNGVLLLRMITSLQSAQCSFPRSSSRR